MDSKSINPERSVSVASDHLTILQAIEIAKEQCKNGYAQTYLRAIEEARAMCGEQGVKTQLLYCLVNMRTWKGELAKEVKRVFKEYVNGK